MDPLQQIVAAQKASVQNVVVEIIEVGAYIVDATKTIAHNDDSGLLLVLRQLETIDSLNEALQTPTFPEDVQTYSLVSSLWTAGAGTSEARGRPPAQGPPV